jgi:hypothetical protein
MASNEFKSLGWPFMTSFLTTSPVSRNCLQRSWGEFPCIQLSLHRLCGILVTFEGQSPSLLWRCVDAWYIEWCKCESLICGSISISNSAYVCIFRVVAYHFEFGCNQLSPGKRNPLLDDFQIVINLIEFKHNNTRLQPVRFW